MGQNVFFKNVDRSRHLCRVPYSSYKCSGQQEMLQALLEQNRPAGTLTQGSAATEEAVQQEYTSSPAAPPPQQSQPQTPDRPRPTEQRGFAWPAGLPTRQRQEDTRSRSMARPLDLVTHDYRPGSLDRVMSDGTYKPWGNFESIS